MALGLNLSFLFGIKMPGNNSLSFGFRFFDIIISFLGLVLFSPIILVLYILGLFDTGSPLFFQVRVGRDKVPFVLVKFRTMQVKTASVATHLADSSSVTNYGRFLRHSKLDELPQLWNVFKGDMSLVGPRPCLFNQESLIKHRDNRNVFSVRPGITGLAQICQVDMSRPELLARVDSKMILNLTFNSYFKYIFYTFMGAGRGDKISKH